MGFIEERSLAGDSLRSAFREADGIRRRPRVFVSYGPEENVLQDLMLPEVRPVLNHCARWAEVPCVNLSGITRPVACFWRRSSPTAAAALIADAMSLWSIRLRCSVELPQTPAR